MNEYKKNCQKYYFEGVDMYKEQGYESFYFSIVYMFRWTIKYFVFIIKV